MPMLLLVDHSLDQQEGSISIRWISRRVPSGRYNFIPVAMLHVHMDDVYHHPPSMYSYCNATPATLTVQCIAWTTTPHTDDGQNACMH
jgi:hypothetical protein